MSLHPSALHPAQETPDEPRARRWRRPLIAAAALGLATAGAVAVMPNALAATFNQEGWSTMAGGTTGGGSGPTVTVTSVSAFTSAAGSSTQQTVRLSGFFSCSTEITVASNKTIIGVGANSGLTGCGLRVKSVDNVIIRNLVISKVPASVGDGDAIHIEKATHVWVDHNDLSSDTSHGTDFYDGLVDITHAADYITVSWNKEHDHIKCDLLGHSDDNAAEDTGHLRVTYHHNWFNNCDQRGPRVRFGNPVHVYNNYYFNSGTYGVASTCNAGVYVERNYFENTPNSVVNQTGSSPTGNVKLLNNFLANSGTPVSSNPGSVAAIPYSYTVDANSSVKSIVTGGAGTGKI
ncbi:MAG TPA: pectate lyase [Rugosimonospora sp.]|nr:pectate lyase [Rugosimonospora sp.]